MRAHFMILLIPLTSMVSGCSVFGIATKGDLETHSREQAREQAALQTKARSLQSDLGTILTQLTELRDEVRPRILALSGDIDDLEVFYVESRRSLESISQRLASARLQVGELENSFGQVQIGLASVRDSVGAVSADVNTVQATAAVSVELASRAQRQTQLLRQAYLEELRAERERLTSRLRDLERRLQQFATAPLPQ